MENLDSLSILDNSWSRDRILNKIKKGQRPKEIVEDFINQNKDNIYMANILINEKNAKLFEYIENLSKCETMLIQRIKDVNKLEDTKDIKNANKLNPLLERYSSFNPYHFIQNWSNQFVIALLITISLISLTKQAWA
tara:strand:+ start:210 stop:620 length:411 start_codon:yes stop_codon:yes gene_type:complete